MPSIDEIRSLLNFIEVQGQKLENADEPATGELVTTIEMAAQKLAQSCERWRWASGE